MQLTKKQRLLTGPKVEGLLELLEDATLTPERTQTLVAEILRLQARRAAAAARGTELTHTLTRARALSQRATHTQPTNPTAAPPAVRPSSQLNEILRGHAEFVESDAQLAATSAATRVCDLIDSRLATLFKGWIFRHLAAEVATQDVLESSLAHLADVVVVARSQPIGALVS